MVPGEDDLGSEALSRDVPESGFRQLAEFRSPIGQFLQGSEEARPKGIEPQQHELLLVIKGLSNGTKPTVTTLSRQLFLQHHSTVELVDRLVARGHETVPKR